MRYLAVILALLGVSFTSAQAAEEASQADVMRLEVRDASAQPAAAGGSSAIRMLLNNPTEVPIVLVGASTSLAGQTLLQTYVNNADGLVQVKQLAALRVPAKSSVVLVPGVMELQLVGVITELQPGLELPLKLKFEGGAERTVRIAIEGDKN